jgi:threonine/homoserine/homoserine lactone efflux protein
LQSGAQIVLSGIQLVLAGILIGVLVAAPIGPVNVLCIQRTVSLGFFGGVAAGLGAMLGDGTLAAIAAFSMTAISDVMLAYAAPIRIAGGLVLIGFGVMLLARRPVLKVSPGEESRLWEHTGIIPHTYFLTVTNPGAILGMLAIFGGLGSLIGGLNYFEALLLVVAVMGGSLLWWISLAELISTIRHKLTEQRFKLINRIAGTVLLAFGAILVVEGLLHRLP